jgi:hypothetical protein
MGKGLGELHRGLLGPLGFHQNVGGLGALLFGQHGQKILLVGDIALSSEVVTGSRKETRQNKNLEPRSDFIGE